MAKFHREDEPPPPPPADNRCAAYGCPLPGTIFRGADRERGVCRYHLHLEVHEYDAMTLRLNRHVRLVRFARELAGLYDVMPVGAGPDGYPELARRQGEGWRAYEGRVHRYVLAVLKIEPKRQQDAEASSSPGFERIAGFLRRYEDPTPGEKTDDR